MTDQLQELNNRRVNINDHIQKSFMNKHPKAMVVTEELFDEAFSKGLFVEYVDIYNDNLEKSYDKSKLQPRKVTDKNGHQRTVWVVRDNSLHSKEFNPNGVMQKRELTKEDIESVKGHEDKLSHINRVRFKKEYDKHFGDIPDTSSKKAFEGYLTKKHGDIRGFGSPITEFYKHPSKEKIGQYDPSGKSTYLIDNGNSKKIEHPSTEEDDDYNEDESKTIAERYKQISDDYADDPEMTHGDIVRSIKQTHGGTRGIIESAMAKHGVDKHSYVSPEDKEEMRIKSTPMPSKGDYNSNGVNKGYLSIWEKKEFDSKPYFEDRLSSVNKMSKLSEQEERYINSLNVVEIKGEQIKDINELFKKDDKLMDKPFVVKANSGKYLVDPQGYDYTRYISKLPTPHSKSNQENKFSITDDNIDKLLNIVSNGWDDETAIRNFKRYTGESTKDADVAREHFEEDVKERRLSPEAVEEYFGNSGIFD